jgi:hypothetical protein
MKLTRQITIAARFAATVLFAAALCFTTKTASAQDLARGTFTLPTAAKLGATTLPAGEYRFSVISLDSISSVESVRSNNTPVEVTLIGTDRDAPIISVMANAQRPAAKSLLTNTLEFSSANAIQSISLKNLGITIDFTTRRPVEAARTTHTAPATTIAAATN